MVSKIDVLIIGSGHYSTGTTILSGKKQTDKDFGILLPSILQLQKDQLVNKIFLATRDGSKIPKLRKKVEIISNKLNLKTNIQFFPSDGSFDENSYKKALTKLPTLGAVLIATPDFTHKQIILDTIRANHHFMIVKPAVVKLRDLKDILKSMSKKRLLGLVDYHKVYDEANLILKDEYNSGKYGDIQHILTKQTQRRDMLEIFKNWAGKHKHNINHYLGSHYIHLVGFITKATPLNVRATCQYGIAKSKYKINTPDLIETQVEWLSKNKTHFTSYHIAGWSDPSETANMTYQEVHIISTKGNIDSDQRYRGFESTLSEEGHRVINPYFFHLNNDLLGKFNLENKYGYKSIKTFIESSISIENGAPVNYFEGSLPTIKDSLYVTAILEAADKSLKNNSSVVNLAFN